MGDNGIVVEETADRCSADSAWSLLHHRGTLPTTSWAALQSRRPPYERETQAARSLVERRAEHGSVLDGVQLGLALMSGRATFPRDKERGRSLLLKAAELGDANAMAIVGAGQVFGSGFTRNPRQGWRWVRRAAAAGHRASAVELRLRRQRRRRQASGVALLGGGLAAAVAWWATWQTLWGLLLLLLGLTGRTGALLLVGDVDDDSELYDRLSDYTPGS